MRPLPATTQPPPLAPTAARFESAPTVVSPSPISPVSVPAQPTWRWLPPAPPPAYGAPPTDGDVDVDAVDANRAARRRSESWMLSVNGVSRTPIDLGVELGLELPVGLRVSAGYGWVPQAYLNVITQLASLGTEASALLNHAFQSGRTWRVQGGIRPFRAVGIYLDGGYSELRLDGSIDAASIPTIPLSGRYTADTTVDMWLIEVGYEGWIGDHVVVGVAGGVVGVTRSNSHLAGPGIDTSQAANVAATFDSRIERYGKVPTLTARLGFDFI